MNNFKSRYATFRSSPLKLRHHVIMLNVEFPNAEIHCSSFPPPCSHPPSLTYSVLPPSLTYSVLPPSLTNGAPRQTVSFLPSQTASLLEKQCSPSLDDKQRPPSLEEQCPPSLVNERPPPSLGKQCPPSLVNQWRPPLKNGFLPVLPLLKIDSCRWRMILYCSPSPSMNGVPPSLG